MTLRSIEVYSDSDRAKYTTMPARTTIESLPIEILIKIFSFMRGKALHDIDPALFAVSEICEVWKYVVYQVLFDINITSKGITLGFDHYLQCRLESLRILYTDKVRDCNKILARKEKELYRVMRPSLANANHTNLRARLCWIAYSDRDGTKVKVNKIVDHYDRENWQFNAKSEIERNSFTKETKDIFGFQSSWGTRRKLIRGVGQNDWVWAEIVAARIESDLYDAAVEIVLKSLLL